MQKLLILFFISGALVSCRAQNKPVLDANEFEKGIAKPGSQIFDVRTSGEFRNGHIRNAMQANWNDTAEFFKRVLALDKEKPVYVYCQAGGRSAAAASWMRTAGFKNVLELKGGMISWIKEKKEVEGVQEEAPMTLEAYQKLITADRIYLVDFGASWCPPCVKMKPVIEELEKKYRDQCTVIRIDGGVQTILMQSLGIESLPTFLVYKKGKLTMRLEGVIEKSVLEQQLH